MKRQEKTVENLLITHFPLKKSQKRNVRRKSRMIENPSITRLLLMYGFTASNGSSLGNITVSKNEAILRSKADGSIKIYVNVNGLTATSVSAENAKIIAEKLENSGMAIRNI